MDITVNGEKQQLSDNASMTDLLETLDLAGKKLAVEVNLDIVPRSTYSDFQLSHGDRVEIVRAIGGG